MEVPIGRQTDEKTERWKNRPTYGRKERYIMIKDKFLLKRDPILKAEILIRNFVSFFTTCGKKN
jgi:hypothetical protein